MEVVDEIKNKYKYFKCWYLKILLVIFIIWLMVSAYFYNQHLLTVKTYPLNKEVQIGDGIVRLRELSLVNYRLKTSFTYKLPWYDKVAAKIPQPFRYYFIRTCEFYSRSYKFNDKVGSLTLKGYIIVPKSNLSPAEIRKYIDNIELFDSKNVGYANSWGVLNSSKNLFFITCKGNNVPLDISPVIIAVTDIKTNTTKKVTVTPIWKVKTYNFFSSRPEDFVSPLGKTVSSFLSAYKSSKVNKEKKFLVQNEKFDWSRLTHDFDDYPYSLTGNFEGNYLGHKDTCSVNVLYLDRENTHLIVAKQKFYLCEQNRVWKIINVEPVVKYKKKIERNSH